MIIGLDLGFEYYPAGVGDPWSWKLSNG